MATVSFERDLIIGSEEEARRMLDAIDEADRRGPVKYPDFHDLFKRGKEFLERGPKE